MISGVVAAQGRLASGALFEFVGAASAGGNNTTTTVNIPPGEAGDLLLTFAILGNQLRSLTISPSGFLTQRLNDADTVNNRVYVHSRLTTGSEPSSFTINSTTYHRIVVVRLRGVTAVTTIPASRTAGLSAASISPAADGVLVGAWFAEGSTAPSTFTPPGDMTYAGSLLNSNGSVAVAYKLGAPAGSSGIKTASLTPPLSVTVESAILLHCT